MTRRAFHAFRASQRDMLNSSEVGGKEKLSASFPASSFFYPVKMRPGSQVKRLARDGWRGQEAFAELIFSQ